jgi:hypothetical protein
MQEDLDGVDRPVCYFSEKLNKHQLNYSTIEKEALALVLCLESPGYPVRVFTDHNPLVFLSKMKNHTQKLMRRFSTIQEYNLDITYSRIG